MKTRSILIGLFFAGVVVSTNAAINDGLIAYYPFNSNANDESGFGNHGKVYGAALTEDPSGAPNKAYRFNGVSDEILISHSTLFDFNTSSPQSISLWAYRESNGSIMHLIGKRVNCSSFNYQIAFNESDGSNIVYTQIAAENKKLPVAQWVHLVGTFDGTYGRIYMNGTLISQKVMSMEASNTAPLKIGGSGSCARFTGKLDEIRIYNRAITKPEVTQLYNQYVPVGITVKSIPRFSMTCKNETTGQIVSIKTTTLLNQSCEATGLSVNPGDFITISVQGAAQ